MQGKRCLLWGLFVSDKASSVLYECSSTGLAGAFLRMIGFYQVCQVNINEASDSPKHKEISQLLFILEGYDDITCVCTGNSIFCAKSI